MHGIYLCPKFSKDHVIFFGVQVKGMSDVFQCITHRKI